MKLHGMLADLRDVDGLPPKSPTSSSLSSQARSHEGDHLVYPHGPIMPVWQGRGWGGGRHSKDAAPPPLSLDVCQAPEQVSLLPLHPGSLGCSSDVFIMDTIGGGEVSLGDLADLTVTNDNELSCDVSSHGHAAASVCLCPPLLQPSSTHPAGCWEGKLHG